jgi:hypothetical protein
MIENAVVTASTDALAGEEAARWPSLRAFVEQSHMRSVIIGTSKDPNAKITILLLPVGGDRPVLALKVPTTDLAARAVEREGRMLVEVRRRCRRSFMRSIPRVVDLLEFNGRTALVATAVPGVPMSTAYLRWRHTARHRAVASDFAIASHWIAALQKETARDPGPLDIGQDAAGILANRYADESKTAACIQQLEAICERLRTNRTPRTAVHGDLWFGNMLTTGGRITGVVDWELGLASGEPVRDLVRFPLMYALYLDRHTFPGGSVAGHRGLRRSMWGAGIAHAIDGDGWFPDLVRGFIQGGLHRLGASPGSWRDAALAGVAEVAATTDDREFGRHHLELFHRLTESPARNGKDRS